MPPYEASDNIEGVNKDKEKLEKVGERTWGPKEKSL